MFSFEHHKIKNVLKYSQNPYVLMESWTFQICDKKIFLNYHKKSTDLLEKLQINSFATLLENGQVDWTRSRNLVLTVICLEYFLMIFY